MQTKSKRNMEIQARKKNEKIMQICVFLRFMCFQNINKNWRNKTQILTVKRTSFSKFPYL